MSMYANTMFCRFHPNSILIDDYRAGDMICAQCGLVVGERMVDVSTEWRTFSDDTNDTNKSRVGAADNLLFDNPSYETITKSSNNKILSGPQKQHIIKPDMPNDKVLRDAFDTIRLIASCGHLTKKVTDRAFLIIKQCHKNKILRGFSLGIFAATCLYDACRKEDVPRTLKEISDMSKEPETKIRRCLAKIRKFSIQSDTYKRFDPTVLVSRFCSQLDLSEEKLVSKTATHIVNRAYEVCDIQSRSPSCIVGAAIYLACLALLQNKTRKDIQQIVRVSEGSIRILYRILFEHAAQLFPVDFDFKCPISQLPSS